MYALRRILDTTDQLLFPSVLYQISTLNHWGKDLPAWNEWQPVSPLNRSTNDPAPSYCDLDLRFEAALPVAVLLPPHPRSLNVHERRAWPCTLYAELTSSRVLQTDSVTVQLPARARHWYLVSRANPPWISHRARKPKASLMAGKLPRVSI